MHSLVLLTSCLTLAVTAYDHPAGHAEAVNLAATSSRWTTIYISEGVTATMVLPVPATTSAIATPAVAEPPPAITPPVESAPPLPIPTLAVPTVVIAEPPTVVTAAAGHVICDGSVLGMAVACGLGMLAL